MAREIERRAVSTVCIMNLRRVAERIRPPRTLLVDQPFGQLLGQPGARDEQLSTLSAALAMLEDPTAEPGEIREGESR